MNNDFPNVSQPLEHLAHPHASGPRVGNSLTFPGRMLALAQNWRMGADELRAQFATGSEVKSVPFAVAACAGTIEACAQRLENEVADWYAGKYEPSHNAS